MSNSTLKYIGKRLVISLITLFVILMVLFLMVKFLPGSPINNEKLSASARAAIEAQYGLDQSNSGSIRTLYSKYVNRGFRCFI